MTKKKRELIEILLDNVKPEDWPESLPYAAHDKCDSAIYVYSGIPDITSIYNGCWHPGSLDWKFIKTVDVICKLWNKTIVHRDEFMNRWDERNSAEVKTLTFSREGIDPVTLTEKMEKISIKPDADSEGWIQWDDGEMPVEKGTLIDVKYRDGRFNMHVKAGENPSGGSITDRCAVDFKHDDNPGDIIAYRLHVPQEQKTPQQVALEKFGTDWHENEGVQPFSDTQIKIDLEFKNGTIRENVDVYSSSFIIPFDTPEFTVTKWRIHSDEKESQISEKEKALESLLQPMPHCREEIPCRFVDEKSPIETQVGGDHYTKLSIQPMQYSMKNGLDALQHTIIKYVTRFRDKAGIEDLEKAKHCIDMLIEFERGKK